MGEPRWPEGLVLFEVYEPSGALLVVTSDSVEARASMLEGDRLFRRPWATASQPEPVPAPAALADPTETATSEGER